ncbi:hypothetical protein [Deinococcus seoulensis]|nr:hypothetical protein [Deinococcus seoulensis]
MHPPRITLTLLALTLLALTTHAHARDDGSVTPRPGAAPTQPTAAHTDSD